jgi:poly(ADP-ribose) glycohydrolase
MSSQVVVHGRKAHVHQDYKRSRQFEQIDAEYLSLENWYVMELKPRLAGKQMFDDLKSFDEICRGRTDGNSFATDFRVRLQEDRRALEHRLMARMRTQLQGEEIKQIAAKPIHKRKLGCDVAEDGDVKKGGYPGHEVTVKESSDNSNLVSKFEGVVEQPTRNVSFLHDSTDHAERWGKVVDILSVVAQSGVADSDTLCNVLYEVRSCISGTSYRRTGLAALRKSIARLPESICAESAFLQETVRWMAQHALELAKYLPKGLPVLAQGMNGQVFLSRRTCAAVTCAAFFGLLLDQGNDTPRYNLAFVLDADFTKTQCLLSYLTQVAGEAAESLDKQYVSFARRAAPNPTAYANDKFWKSLDKPLLPVHVNNSGSIEAASGALQADFANEFLGGGVLNGGNVQEEIRFSVCPECLVGMLFCERMLPHEAIFVVGAQQYSFYSGYGMSFRFTRCCTSRAPLDEHQRADVQIVALDALCFPGNMQYGKGLIIRELQKAFVANIGDPLDDAAAKAASKRRFATGNWGCGVFGGDPQLKSLIQWLAASACGRELDYYVYGDKRVANLEHVVKEVSKAGVSCSQFFEVLVKAARAGSGQVFDQILRELKDGSAKTP